MPIIKSAKKRVRTSERKSQINQLQRVGAKTAIRTAVRAVAASDNTAATLVQQAASRLDRAAAQGAIHKNKAARLKSRLAAKLKTAGIATAQAKPKEKAKAVKKSK